MSKVLSVCLVLTLAFFQHAHASEKEDQVRMVLLAELVMKSGVAEEAFVLGKLRSSSLDSVTLAFTTDSCGKSIFLIDTKGNLRVISATPGRDKSAALKHSPDVVEFSVGSKNVPFLFHPDGRSFERIGWEKLSKFEQKRITFMLVHLHIAYNRLKNNNFSGAMGTLRKAAETCGQEPQLASLGIGHFERTDETGGAKTLVLPSSAYVGCYGINSGAIGVQ